MTDRPTEPDPAQREAQATAEAASIAKQYLAEGKTIRQVVIERGHVDKGTLTEAQLDDALDVLRMTYP